MALSIFSIVPDFEVESIARCLLPALQAFYNSREKKAAFEGWKSKRNSKQEETG